MKLQKLLQNIQRQAMCVAPLTVTISCHSGYLLEAITAISHFCSQKLCLCNNECCYVTRCHSLECVFVHYMTDESLFFLNIERIHKKITPKN
jgi:hypothetical protein